MDPWSLVGGTLQVDASLDADATHKVLGHATAKALYVKKDGRFDESSIPTVLPFVRIAMDSPRDCCRKLLEGNRTVKWLELSNPSGTLLQTTVMNLLYASKDGVATDGSPNPNSAVHTLVLSSERTMRTPFSQALVTNPNFRTNVRSLVLRGNGVQPEDMLWDSISQWPRLTCLYWLVESEAPLPHFLKYLRDRVRFPSLQRLSIQWDFAYHTEAHASALWSAISDSGKKMQLELSGLRWPSVFPPTFAISQILVLDGARAKEEDINKFLAFSEKAQWDVSHNDRKQISLTLVGIPACLRNQLRAKKWRMFHTFDMVTKDTLLYMANWAGVAKSVEDVCPFRDIYTLPGIHQATQNLRALDTEIKVHAHTKSVLQACKAALADANTLVKTRDSELADSATSAQTVVVENHKQDLEQATAVMRESIRHAQEEQTKTMAANEHAEQCQMELRTAQEALSKRNLEFAQIKSTLTAANEKIGQMAQAAAVSAAPLPTAPMQDEDAVILDTDPADDLQQRFDDLALQQKTRDTMFDSLQRELAAKAKELQDLKNKGDIDWIKLQLDEALRKQGGAKHYAPVGDAAYTAATTQMDELRVKLAASEKEAAKYKDVAEAKTEAVKRLDATLILQKQQHENELMRKEAMQLDVVGSSAVRREVEAERALKNLGTAAMPAAPPLIKDPMVEAAPFSNWHLHMNNVPAIVNGLLRDYLMAVGLQTTAVASMRTVTWKYDKEVDAMRHSANEAAVGKVDINALNEAGAKLFYDSQTMFHVADVDPTRAGADVFVQTFTSLNTDRKVVIYVKKFNVQRSWPQRMQGMFPTRVQFANERTALERFMNDSTLRKHAPVMQGMTYLQNQYHYISMHPVNGIELHKMKEAARCLGAAFVPSKEAQELVARNAINLLEATHRIIRIVHNDLHPRNVYIGSDGAVSFADFANSYDPEGSKWAGIFEHNVREANEVAARQRNLPTSKEPSRSTGWEECPLILSGRAFDQVSLYATFRLVKWHDAADHIHAHYNLGAHRVKMDHELTLLHWRNSLPALRLMLMKRLFNLSMEGQTNSYELKSAMKQSGAGDTYAVDVGISIDPGRALLRKQQADAKGNDHTPIMVYVQASISPELTQVMKLDQAVKEKLQEGPLTMPIFRPNDTRSVSLRLNLMRHNDANMGMRPIVMSLLDQTDVVFPDGYHDELLQFFKDFPYHFANGAPIPHPLPANKHPADVFINGDDHDIKLLILDQSIDKSEGHNAAAIRDHPTAAPTQKKWPHDTRRDQALRYGNEKTPVVLRQIPTILGGVVTKRYDMTIPGAEAGYALELYALERLQNMASIHRRIFPYLVQVSEGPRYRYLVMNKLAGVSLSVLHERAVKQLLIPSTDFQAYVAHAICERIRFLHKSDLMHCNLTGSKVLVNVDLELAAPDNSGTGGEVAFVDFSRAYPIDKARDLLFKDADYIRSISPTNFPSFTGKEYDYITIGEWFQTREWFTAAQVIYEGAAEELGLAMRLRIEMLVREGGSAIGKHFRMAGLYYQAPPTPVEEAMQNAKLLAEQLDNE